MKQSVFDVQEAAVMLPMSIRPCECHADAFAIGSVDNRTPSPNSVMARHTDAESQETISKFLERWLGIVVDLHEPATAGFFETRSWPEFAPTTQSEVLAHDRLLSSLLLIFVMLQAGWAVL